MKQWDSHRPWLVRHDEKTAHEFVDLLSPVSGIFSTAVPHEFLFRGIRDIKHLLIPAAFRPGARLLLPTFDNGKTPTNRQQIRRELETLIAFIKAADRQGHLIPEDSQGFRTELKALTEDLADLSTTSMKEWPTSSLLSVLALAQHYSVPTRLLDWSLDPYVAAYFAAVNAAAQRNKRGKLAVWAVATSSFTINEILVGDKAAVAKLPVQHVTAPWANNPNAKAQRAVFLAYRQFDIDLQTGFEARSYDDLLMNNLSPGFNEVPHLFCLTLPKSEAPTLLRLLAVQGYDGATAFPGLDGASMSVRESTLWARGSVSNTYSSRAHKIVLKWNANTRPSSTKGKQGR
jgi:hypothetical protein